MRGRQKIGPRAKIGKTKTRMNFKFDLSIKNGKRLILKKERKKLGFTYF